MGLLLALVLFQVDAGRELDDLLRSLGSDSPEERERAEARLKEIGPSARAALEQLAKTGESEVRGRARGILDDLDRLDRVKSFLPLARKVTVRLRDSTLPEAVAQTLSPLGLSDVTFGGTLGTRKITLNLKDATFWEAVAGLEEAAGATFVSSSRGFEDRPRPTGTFSQSGAARVGIGEGWGAIGRGGEEVMEAVFPQAEIPPGTWAFSPEIEDLKVQDGDGKPVEFAWEPKGKCIRKSGQVSRVELGNLGFLKKNLKGISSLVLSGTVILGFPRDIDRRVIPRIPGSVTVPGGEVKIAGLTKSDRGDWYCDLTAKADDAPLTALVSVEDELGRWLGDLTGTTVERFTSWSTNFSAPLIEGIPARGIVHVPVGKEILRLPFRFTCAPEKD